MTRIVSLSFFVGTTRVDTLASDDARQESPRDRRTFAEVIGSHCGLLCDFAHGATSAVP
jgi:hypothetical protein